MADHLPAGRRTQGWILRIAEVGMSGWGERAISRSRSSGRTTPELSAWVLSVADRSLSEVFGDDYSIRCLQSTACIQSVLEAVGVRSIGCVGALCAATAYAG